MHATLPAESVLPSRQDSDFVLSGQTLRPNESIRGIVYFPKTSVEKIKEERVFNLNIDLGQGKKAVVVFQK